MMQNMKAETLSKELLQHL